MEKWARPTIVLLGDSITQFSFDPEQRGWGAGLANWYHRSADVVNRGFSGYNSRWIKQALPSMFPTSFTQIDLLTIMLGANDAVMEGPGTQHVSLQEYTENIKACVVYFQALNPLCHIILITPPNVNSILWPDRATSLVCQYAEAVRCIGISFASPRVHVLDLWGGGEDAAVNNELDLFDGLHFGEGANKKTLSGLQAIVRERIPEMNPEEGVDGGAPNLPMHFYNHRVIREDEATTQKMLLEWRW